ncbi:related to aspartyl-tRNA synthetase [Phialocephala subalpina]|uniref:Related to aspartyl-tRNA synthetase n=1 Tax=Phialocephala subalpina TaxID=576137 RepID=A0A1L7WSJ3_9HELO|nr:related to aspartyl-tRNA synthetase [Phialocephala subalpina]
MTIAACSARHVLRRCQPRTLTKVLWSAPSSLPGQLPARCFHQHHRLEEAAGDEGQSRHNVADAQFWKEFKSTYGLGFPTRFAKNVRRSMIGNTVVAAGHLHKIINLGEALAFAHVQVPSAPERSASDRSSSELLQIVCQDAALCKKLNSIRPGSAVGFRGTVAKKRAPKKGKEDMEEPLGDKRWESVIPINEIELKADGIKCLNSFPADIHHGSDHVFPPQHRHLQIRYDTELKERLVFRSAVAAYVRESLSEFQEIETPILFKSTPEGAKEFLVPTRRQGYAYALPQSPQQYKQILMASGIHRYFQFARCFRDEDLRADRQPEFTQIDLEMAFTDGRGVMGRVQTLIKDIYKKFAKPGTLFEYPTRPQRFWRLEYDKAMSKYGSDKPDLRLKGLIHRIDQTVSPELRNMITSIKKPVIEAFKVKLNASPAEVQKFITTFLDSPEAEIFNSNPDGAPGIFIYDPRKPLTGLSAFGHEGSQKLEYIYSQISQQPWEDDLTHEANCTFNDGDLLVVQARPDLPFSGGSTMIGKLRLAIEKAAIAEGLVEQDPRHIYLWVTDFPMFTLENGGDPGQGGKAGFSATHHPFTAPKSDKDVDLLLWKPLEAKADHYDLVVNGVELGGGSRRIHNAEMQRFVMKNILKMSDDRINDFSHLLEALRTGCPPHAGFAIGFDRLIAVMTGRESVRDVIAFPKSSKGEDMMVKSPGLIRPEELKRYGLDLSEGAKEALEKVKADSQVE